MEIAIMLMSNRVIFFMVLFLSIMISFSACKDQKIEARPHKVMFIHGLIDSDFVETLKNIPDDYDGVVVGSVGGESNFAIAAAKLVEKKELDVIIDGSFGVCTSGCAEYLLPAAKRVYFVRKPLIGYHQNPQMVYHFLSEGAERDFQFCSYIEKEVTETVKLLNRKKLNPKFWSYTLDKLSLKKVSLYYYEDQCPGINYEFENELWFPSSVQLRDLLWLKFDGDLCADSEECITNSIHKTWPGETSYVVADDVFENSTKKVSP